MEPMKREPLIKSRPPVNNNPLTRKDAFKIARAITSFGHAKWLQEDICGDDPGADAVDEFLDQCRTMLLNELLRKVHPWDVIPK